ncbi:hypothetical protein NDU88_001032 [Pleurodeles waltl]|uniref:Uncharacterized protein n=1 Tax=Pleurodeles waltl TaxID=8319 RepID=A0AAV7USX5_PLEWA|nr:hypothetical protein NDU88_001032 [Pleurodeles waltl]
MIPRRWYCQEDRKKRNERQVFGYPDIRVPSCDGVLLSALRALSILSVCFIGNPDIRVPGFGVICSRDIRYPATTS